MAQYKEQSSLTREKSGLDPMSLFGWVVGIVLVIFGIIVQMPDAEKGLPFALLWDNLIRFYDLNSIFIVMGGTLAALMVSYPLSYFKKIPGHLKIIVAPTKYHPQEYIKTIVELTGIARKDGILALQDRANEISNVFFRNSLNLVIDGVDSEKVKQIMESELDYMDERHAQDRAFYAKGSSYAPAFGMIGTLIGLVNLLKNLSDADAIAPAMAVALITTFYGSLLSNLVFAPIANKLKVRHDEEYLCKMLVCEGVQAILAGDNPRFVEEKLNQMLPSKLAQGLEEDMDSKAKKQSKKAKK